METVLIADDEHEIRDGLKLLIDWEELGFEICAEASNGEEALQKMLTLEPSLTLLDIKLPKMYGTEIIRIAREKGYKGKVLILSGYAEFSYAQIAMRYGAESYLTKPIDEDELTEAVRRIKSELEQEHTSSKQIRSLKHKAKDVILHEIITGSAADASALSRQELRDMNLDADIYQVVIYEKFGMEPQDVGYSFADLLKITNKGNHTFEYLKEDQNEVILLKGRYALSRFEDFLKHYEQNPPQPGSPMHSLFLAYGHPVESLSEISLSYEEAAALCRRRFFCVQDQHTLGYKELPDLEKRNLDISTESLNEYSSKLTGYLLSFNRNKIAETLYDLEDYLYHVRNDIKTVKLFLTDLYFQIKESANRIYNSGTIPFPTNTQVMNYIENCHYLYEIIRFLSEQLEQIIQATGNPNRDTILDDVLYYIDHNYQKNLKLETIAPLFGYSSGYLGKIFSKTVGENFVSYLDRKRIEHAKILLEQNNLKVYEIAEQVGYCNVDYFHKKFKKFEKISPAEYRKQFFEK